MTFNWIFKSRRAFQIEYSELLQKLEKVKSADVWHILSARERGVQQDITSMESRSAKVLDIAERLYREAPDWVTFFREILGVDGAVRKAFPTFDELTTFEQGRQFDKIQKLLVRLREKRSSVDFEQEPTRVITIRLPKSMHEYLRTEAHDLRTSMNKLCISKLLQVIGEDMIPNDQVSSELGGSGSGSSKPIALQSPTRTYAPVKPILFSPNTSQPTGQSSEEACPD